MRRVTPWFIAALVTFVIGTATSVWISRNRSTATVPANLATYNAQNVFAKEIDPGWVYINKDMKWESPSKIREFHFDYKYSVNEHVLVFYPGGEFAEIGCTIYRNIKTQKMQFIPNEGFGVCKGSWKHNDDGTITIASRLTSSNKLATSLIAKQKEERIQQLRIRKVDDHRLAAEFDLSGEVFVPSPSIEGINELLSFPDGDI